MKALSKVWSNYRYNIKDNVLISNKIISESINAFWSTNVKSLTSSQHIIVIFRIKTSDGMILTLGHLQKIN